MCQLFLSPKTRGMLGHGESFVPRQLVYPRPPDIIQHGPRRPKDTWSLAESLLHGTMTRERALSCPLVHGTKHAPWLLLVVTAREMTHGQQLE